MADNGWIKLHRKLMDKAIWQCSTSEQKVILITLLMMANHEEKEWEWRGEKYAVKPGEFITSLNSIKEIAGKGITIQKIRTAIERFEKYEFLTSKSTNRNRLITIVNWELYQSNEKEITSKITSNQQAGNKQVTTNKNDKNDKNDKKNIYKDFSPELKQALLDFESMRKVIKAPLTDRAKEMLLTKLDKLARTDIEKIKILEQSILGSWKGIYPLKDGRDEIGDSRKPDDKSSKFDEYNLSGIIRG